MSFVWRQGEHQPQRQVLWWSGGTQNQVSQQKLKTLRSDELIGAGDAYAESVLSLSH